MRLVWLLAAAALLVAAATAQGDVDLEADPLAGLDLGGMNVGGLDVGDILANQGDMEACGNSGYMDSEEAQAASEACSSIQGGIDVCPEPCARWLQGLPDVCKSVISTLWAGISQDVVNYINDACGTDFTPGTGGPTPEESPEPEPVESPEPEPSQEPEPSPEPSLSPSIPDLPQFSSHFECEGDGYSWIPLDPEAASQFEKNPLAPESVAGQAVAGNCTEVTLGANGTASGCCAETGGGLVTWWQYQLSEPMQVKGIQVLIPQGDDCCTDIQCKSGETEACSNRLMAAQVVVGNFSLPEFYASDEFAELVNVTYAGDESLAQAAAWGSLLSEDSLCNLVTDFDLFDPDTNDLLESANIGCGLGVAGMGNEEPSGEYVSIALTSDPPRSLAVCGLKICARTL